MNIIERKKKLIKELQKVMEENNLEIDRRYSYRYDLSSYIDYQFSHGHKLKDICFSNYSITCREGTVYIIDPMYEVDKLAQYYCAIYVVKKGEQNEYN